MSNMGGLAEPEDEMKVGGNQVDTPYLTSWCGGMGCDNCKLCLIFSGKAKLIKADDLSHKLTYRIIAPYGGK